MSNNTTEQSGNVDMLQLGNFAYQEQRFDDAFLWYTKAALQGTPKAQYKLAQMYSKGQGTEQNDKLALRWMKAAAAKGLSRAEYSYANMLEFGRGLEKPQPKEAAKWYQKAAKQRHPDAMIKLSKLYFDGVLIEHDAYQSLKWAIKAGETGINKNKAEVLRKQAFQHILKNARQGNPDDQYLIGKVYLQGMGVKKNKNKAMSWLTKAAKLNNNTAQYELGLILLENKSSWQQALSWLKKAARGGHIQAGYKAVALQGIYHVKAKSDTWRWLYHGSRVSSPKAQYNLAVSLHGGLLGLPKSSYNFDLWLKNASKADVTVAQNDFGVLVAGAKGNVKAAIPLLKASASKNDAKAQYNLGIIFAKGQGITPNDDQAIRWLKRSESSPHGKAEMLLGLFYNLGRGVARDEEQALGWYRKATEHHEVDAIYNLAILYFNGRGVEQDYKKSAFYLKSLAKKGDTDAQNLYAVLFLDGKGVKFSPDKAAYWFEQAAQKGHVQAMFNLATLYRGGFGLTQNDKAALYWYKKAAAHNYAPAQNAIGYLYAEGRGVKKNIDKAEEWLYKASDNGLKIADKNLNILHSNGNFSLVTIQTNTDIRTNLLTSPDVKLSDLLEAHHQPIL